MVTVVVAVVLAVEDKACCEIYRREKEKKGPVLDVETMDALHGHMW